MPKVASIKEGMTLSDVHVYVSIVGGMTRRGEKGSGSGAANVVVNRISFGVACLSWESVIEVVSWQRRWAAGEARLEPDLVNLKLYHVGGISGVQGLQNARVTIYIIHNFHN